MLSWLSNLFRSPREILDGLAPAQTWICPTPAVDLVRLARLQRDTDEILAAAPKSLGGAVNWGNLSCWRSLEWFDDSGDHGLAVEISEVSPDAGELIRHVATELLKRGWPNVEVRTEW